MNITFLYQTLRQAWGKLRAKQFAKLAAITWLLSTWAFSTPTLAQRIETARRADKLSTPGDFLRQGFAAPPLEARTRCIWWWLNSNVTQEAITRDLEQMQAKGFGGALLFDASSSSFKDSTPVPPGPKFGSPEWRELFRHAVSEASRLKLELSLNIQSGWNLGGPDVQPTHAAKQLTWSETTLQGSDTFSGKLPAPESRQDFYRDIAVLAYRLRDPAPHPPIQQLELKSAYKEIGGSAPDCRPLLFDVPATPNEHDSRCEEVLNLTDRLDSQGKLDWEVPEGTWQVLRFGYTLTGAHVSTSSDHWKGLVVDYMSSEALQDYWDTQVEPLLADIKPHLGTTLTALSTDSWECGGMNWTPDFVREFTDRRGYDPLPYLPVIAGKIIENRDVSNRFLADLRKTISDCVAENHYQLFADLAHHHNLIVHPESGGPHAGPFDALKCLGRNDIPMSEFWVPSPHRPLPENRFFVKQAASAAHIYGKQLVGAEGFTSIYVHWNDVPWKSFKPSFDTEACAGLNRLVIHTFTCSPPEMGLPGQEYFAGTHFNPNVTWWEQAGAIIKYFNRCQFLLQQGDFIADVCYYTGDHVPNLSQRKAADPAGVLPDYDYDTINEEQFLKMKVADGNILLPSGMRYRLLVLPDHKILSIPALKKIKSLIHDGATVLGPKPTRTASLTSFSENNDLFQQLTTQIWGNSTAPSGSQQLGRGQILWGQDSRKVLAKNGVAPDFQFHETSEGGLKEKPASGLVDFIHRYLEDQDIHIYFLANQSERNLKLQGSFRISGKQPELWDPLTGKIRKATDFQQTEGATSMPLEFAPYGSVFVVFRSPIATDASGSGVPNFLNYGQAHQIEGPWTVRFDPSWGGPESAHFPELVSWSTHADEGIRHYSGTAIYLKAFELPKRQYQPGQRLFLDLGKVHEIASVRLNGKSLGILWAKPFRVEITDAVQPGMNKLEITMVNNWPNRLIGDADKPLQQRLTKTNVTKYTSKTPLFDAGLLGPVQLLPVEYSFSPQRNVRVDFPTNVEGQAARAIICSPTTLRSSD